MITLYNATMEYNELLDIIRSEKGKDMLQCGECAQLRKKWFQDKLPTLTVQPGDFLRIEFSGSNWKEYLWVKLTETADQFMGKLEGVIDSDSTMPHLQDKSLKRNIDIDDAIDYIGKNWTDMQTARHVFDMLKRLEKEHDKHT